MKLHAVCVALNISIDGVYKVEIQFRASGPTTVTVYRNLPGRFGGEIHLNSMMFVSRHPVSDCVWDAVCSALGMDRMIPARTATLIIDEQVRAIIEIDGVSRDLDGVLDAIKIQREGEMG